MRLGRSCAFVGPNGARVSAVPMLQCLIDPLIVLTGLSTLETGLCTISLARVLLYRFTDLRANP